MATYSSPEAAVAANAVGDTWEWFDPSVATKIDPNTLQVSAPTKKGDNFHELNWDCSVAEFKTPSGMLCYYGAVSGVDLSSVMARIQMRLEVKSPSATRMILGAFLADDPTDFTTAIGRWTALSEETTGNYDRAHMSTKNIFPAAGSSSSTQPLILTDDTVYGGDRIAGLYVMADGSVSPPTRLYEQNSMLVLTGLNNTGSLYWGFLCGNRNPAKTASETIQARLGINTILMT